jgi:hypothetical protein
MMRPCGDCTLCCKLLPVRELGKGANERCSYQRRGQGCTAYGTRKMPDCCKLWNCRWLVNNDTADLSRPDRSHYVIDIMPDFVTWRYDETGETGTMQVVQIWCDPDFPDAHHDPALRAYLMRRAEEGIAALIRYDSRNAFTLMAPPMTSDHEWHEVRGTSTAEHSFVDVVRALAK